MKLSDRLESAFLKYHRKNLIESDPIRYANNYTSKADKECAAFIAACFSYGNVKAIFGVLDEIFSGEFEANLTQNLRSISSKRLRNKTKNTYYRFYSSEDIYAFLSSLQKILIEHETLERAFDQSSKSLVYLDKLQAFAELIRQKMKRSSYGARYFIPSPNEGPAKRLHMFMRWMVRHDEIDLGLWSSVKTSELLIPLDTHIYKASQLLGLTTRKSSSLATVLDITESLKKIDPVDPIRFDFALTRFGMFSDKSL